MATPPPNKDSELWRKRISEWYPNLLERTYVLPPVHMRMTRYAERTLESSGESVLVSEEPVANRGKGEGSVLSQSDVREDDCQQQVLNCLQHLSEEQKEVMFILSQLKFGDYLNEPCYAAAASTLPKPSDLSKDGKHQGDFDVLIIHRRYGVILGEIKSVGADKSFSTFPETKQDQTVKKRVEQAIKQLQKGGDAVQHIVSDMSQRPRVAKTLIMPNITREQLQRVLENDETLSRSLSDCLGLGGVSDPTQVCLLYDDMFIPPRYRNRPQDQPKLEVRRARWWKELVDAAGGEDPMTEDAYLELITRLAGPATTVKVHCSSVPRLAQSQESDIRTPGEGVQESARRLIPADIVLHPSQVRILSDLSLKLVYLAGPPGVGKSLMLLLKAREWLRRGKHVHIISTGESSLAACHQIAYQLECSAGPGEQQRIHLLLKRFPVERNNVERELTEFALQHTRGQELYVIMDEVMDVFSSGHGFPDFCKRLKELIPNLHMWMASIYHERRPPVLTEVLMTEPLRTPPSVTNVVLEHRGFLGAHVKRYSETASPLPSHGPSPIRVHHQGENHNTEKEAIHCEECGKEVARTLRHLDVGGTGRGSQAPLTVRDVFLLTWETLRAERDSEGNQIEPTSGLMKALGEEGFPVTVLEHRDAEGIRQVATNTGPDRIIATGCRVVNGLERKVVIFVQQDLESNSSEDWGKLWAVSRCTSQLIWVKRPGPVRIKPPDSCLLPGYRSYDVQNSKQDEEERPME